MNIFLLKQEFLNIARELEENGGELTPELEKALECNQDDVEDKIKSYVNIIKDFEADIAAIDSESKRLALLKKTKQKAIDRIKGFIIEGVKFFGYVKKSGVPYFDYGTGVVSIRKSKSVDVNDLLLEEITVDIRRTLEYLRNNNQIDVSDTLTATEILDILRYDTDSYGEAKMPVHITPQELNAIKLKVNVTIPIKDIVFSSDKYTVLKEIVKNYYDFKMEAGVDKRELKDLISKDKEDYGNIAALNTNENIKID